MNKGSPSATYWIIGSYPTVNETYKGKAFFGQASEELDRMLSEAGIDISDCYFTYAAQGRPKGNQEKLWFCTKAQFAKQGFLPYGDKYIDPKLAGDFQRLHAEIKKYATDRTVLIPLGATSLLALTGHHSIGDWRGSELFFAARSDLSVPVIPTYEHTAVMRVWEWRYIAVQDLRRASEGAEFHRNVVRETFLIRPTFDEAERELKAIAADLYRCNKDERIYLGVDIETRYGHISCIAIARSPTKAICIPFMAHSSLSGYWTHKEEVRLIDLMLFILQHENVVNCGQNYHYDAHYMARHWGLSIEPENLQDTMTLWHVCYPGLRKSLAFISSMLLPRYTYWKDEGKGHAPDPDKEDQYWVYNCKDAMRTLELVPILQGIVKSMGLTAQAKEQNDLYKPFMRMMLRGTKQDKKMRSDFAQPLMQEIANREVYFESLTPALLGDHKLVKSKTAKPWYRSPKQQVTLFYEIFKLPVQRNKVTKKPTADDQALTVLSLKEPLLAPIFEALIEYRSLGVFLSTFVLAKLDHDGRMRSSYGIGMAETFRCTSSADCFGFGGNLQNIPSGSKEE